MRVTRSLTGRTGRQQHARRSGRMSAEVYSPGPRSLPRTLLGLAEACEVIDLDAATHAVVERAAEGGGGYVCFCNVHVLTSALHDPLLHSALAGAWMRFPDGAPVAWLRRRLTPAAAERIGGPDLMPRVVDVGRGRELRHFLLGSTPDVVSRLQLQLQAAYPGANIVGADSPPYGASDFKQTLATIRAAEAQIVWCALGAPKQELWMQRHADDVGGAVVLGVGAAFDFLAGTKPRAPRWMREHGLEWLHRLGSEPTRLLGRYVRTNSEFLARSAIELARRRLAS